MNTGIFIVSIETAPSKLMRIETSGSSYESAKRNVLACIDIPESSVKEVQLVRWV